MSVQGDFAATIADEWQRCGVTDAVVCPGSRSTPLALALYRSTIRCHVVLDERTAGFTALGLARATGRAVPVVTTSGSAAVELHPAVVEAHHSGVPVVAVTADRPPELHEVGAPQTCEQRGLYGPAVRWEFDPGVARLEARSAWRSIAARTVAEATSGPRGPGPVHLNLPFVEPLVPGPGSLDVPEGRSGGEPWHRVAVAPAPPPRDLVGELVSRTGARGVIVAGHQPGVDGPAYVDGLSRLARALGWPLLADPLSGARGLQDTVVVGAADQLVRSAPFAEAAKPDFVLRIGRPWASREVTGWTDGSGAPVVLVDPFGQWADSGRAATTVARCDPAELASAVGRATPEGGRATPAREGAPAWSERWRRVEASAQAAVDAALEGGALSEPWIARRLVARAGPEDALVVSSSMPVRQVEWFGAPRPGYPVVTANRGVNGIDGVVSTACGVAHSGTCVACVALVGDLAFLHDAGALMGAGGSAAAGTDLTVVVVDNGGGGIFSFLPQASLLEEETFDVLFRTRQATDPADLAAAHGARVVEVKDRVGFDAAMEGGSGGGDDGGRWPRVVVCRVDPAGAPAVHLRIEEAVATAVAGDVESMMG